MVIGISISTKHGIWESNGPFHEAEKGGLSNEAQIVSWDDCSGGNKMGYLGRPSKGALRLSGIVGTTTAPSTVVLAYVNGMTQLFGEFLLFRSYIKDAGIGSVKGNQSSLRLVQM